VSLEQILDRLLAPRPNGSPGLEQAAAFLAQSLERHGAAVGFHEFTATPHGFALAWTASLTIVLAYVAAVARRRYGLALLLIVANAVLLLAEFELLRSPVSGLLTQIERNVVGSWPARAGAPVLLFGAHYDTTTHFGDHFDWGRWGFLQGPATAGAIALAIAGLLRRRRGRALPLRLALPAAAACALPFGAMFVFQTLGPLLRAPSVGAIDNGGSVAALLRLAERLAERPPDAPVEVRIAFFAAEEERTQGSWAYARSLGAGERALVVNLESVGASGTLATIPEDGFALRRFRSPGPVLAFVNEAARALQGAELPSRALPAGTLTDGRSFLAHGIPAVTLRAFSDEGFPRRLHSVHDARERLDLPAIERSVLLLDALVARADASPERFAQLARRR
jgi:acetylornithine deacetylase/succinyl-diaminopimelate desuccinylase-like protein